MKLINIKKENQVITFSVLVDSNSWNETVNKQIENAAKNLKLPGYRPGKMPLDLAKKHIQPNQYLTKASEKMGEKIVDWLFKNDQFLKEMDFICDFEPVKIEPDLKDESNIIFKIDFPTYPEFKVIDIKQLKTDNIKFKVTQEMIDNQTKTDLNKQAMMKSVDRAAKKDDVVTIDFIGYVDKKPFEGGSAKNYELKLGSKSFIDTFEDQLIGVKPNDKKTIKVTFPKDYHVGDLQGKKAEFEVDVKAVNEVETPKLNDEFVKSLGIEKINTVKEYLDHIKQNLTNQINANLDTNIQNELVKQLIDMVPKDIKINNTLIANTTDMLIYRLMVSIMGKVIRIDKFLQMITGKSDEETRKRFIQEQTISAINLIKVKFVVKQYAILLKTEVSEKEIDNQLEKLSPAAKTTPNEIKNDFESYQSFKRDCIEKKVLDVLKQAIKDKLK